MTEADRNHIDGEMRGGRHVMPVYYEDTDFTGIVF